LKDCGLTSFAGPRWDTDLSGIKSAIALGEALKKGIRATNGDDLTKAYSEKLLGDATLADGYSSNIVGVVVINASDAERHGLVKTLCGGKNNTTVVVPENVTKDTVIKSLLAAKKSIQGK
jgi:hypothetical protein